MSALFAGFRAASTALVALGCAGAAIAGCGPGERLRGAAAAMAAERLHGALDVLAVAAGAATIQAASLDRAAAERLLAAAERSAPALRRLAFVTGDGRVFASLGDPPAGAADPRATAALEATGPALRPPGDLAGAAALAGAPVLGPEGGPAGAIVAELDVAAVWEGIAAVLGAEPRCALIDPAGGVRYSPAAAAAGWAEAPPPGGAPPLPGLPGWALACG